MTADESESEVTAPSPDHRTTVGLLRGGWARFVRNPELAGPFVLATLLVVAAQAGITTTSTPYGNVPTFAPWVWPVYVLAFFSVVIGFGVTFLVAVDAADGVQRPFGRRGRIAAERLPTTLLAGVIGGIAVAGGLLTLLIPGLYLMVKFALTFPACMVDDLDAVTGLRRSWLLTGGSLLTIFGLLSLYGIVIVALSVFVTVFFGGSPEPGFVGPFVHNAFMAVLSPLFGLAFGHLYAVRRG